MLKTSFRRIICLYILLFCVSPFGAMAQQTLAAPKLWHNKARVMNYHPDGTDIVCNNGTHRFNRAIYGTNTAFRLEAGDLPEFAMYLPGMGGNLRFGFTDGNRSKWLIEAAGIEARYRAGSMIYTIHDGFLGKGTLKLTVLAGATTESMIVKTEFSHVDAPVSLFWAFGGVTGKKFSRDGDLGADPESSFYLKPEYCRGNNIAIKNNSFALTFTGVATSEADRYEIKQPGIAAEIPPPTADQKRITGTFPEGSNLKLAWADIQASPMDIWMAPAGTAPVLAGMVDLPADNKPLYFYLQSPAETSIPTYTQLPRLFADAEAARLKLATRIVVNTPDPYINTLGGVLGVAADAIWESPSYMHGAVAWRMRLNAWRGPYVADVLGWHDRARSHFSSYALSQITSPESGPNVPDTALHFAREQEKLGNAMFSSGYISRNPGGKIVPHHYDMNLVFIDALLNHFNWTGDLDYVKKMWPVIKRHLAWEKRNFDADGDGLYDAYCAIWASDALQYSGGGVTHSSAYNYRANKTAAYLAKLIGEDPTPYQKEADHILAAINKTLWLPQTGQYAEYVDLLGNKLVHPAAALWTVYHAIDEGIADNFQAYQALRYVDTQIPHIPIISKGLPDGFYTLSTSNWMPYDWSLNNVVLAEELHTSLAYWQGGRAEDAFKLWKGSLLESQFLESSPGNFENMSFYDASRGEAYRDFGDPIGMAGRTLVEGLFGIQPHALEGQLTIKPGFPQEWGHASLHTPDIKFDFKRTGNTDEYDIVPGFQKAMSLVLDVKAKRAHVLEVTINGEKAQWKNVDEAIDIPEIRLNSKSKARYHIKIVWAPSQPTEIIEKPFNVSSTLLSREYLSYTTHYSKLGPTYDPQNIVKISLGDTAIKNGSHTVFVNLKQGDLSWWVPLNVEIKPYLEMLASDKQESNSIKFEIKANAHIEGKLIVNPGPKQFVQDISIPYQSQSDLISVPLANLNLGSNVIRVEYDVRGKEVFQQTLTNWNIHPTHPPKLETIDLSAYYNDKVTNIFKNKYLSPRPTSPTLQLPWQGIGDWCYPLVEANIDDSGLRAAAGDKNTFTTPQGLVFNTPGKADAKNILFTSQWDNYPRHAEVPLSGKSSHAYLLMAGSTNPMQSQLLNGQVTLTYQDGSTDVLALRNPETWWPIEQDYEDDGYAFKLNAARPIRVYLKSGIAALEFNSFKGIKGFTSRGIDGGAATILDLPLNPAKELKSLQLKTIANDVVIGLMSVTLVRE